MSDSRVTDTRSRTPTHTNTKTALIVVDMQNDFIGGSLAVPGSADIIPKINELLGLHKKDTSALCFDLFTHTKDWHPPGHISFADSHTGGDTEGLWPVHCVQNTSGADIHKALNIPVESVEILKGEEKDKECYSALGPSDRKLEKLFKAHKIGNVFVCGLATDVCVYHTVCDILKLGVMGCVCIVCDCCKALDAKHADTQIHTLKESYPHVFQTKTLEEVKDMYP